MTTPKNPGAAIPEDLQPQVLELLERAYYLMPLGTKKRGQWVSDVISMYERMDERRADYRVKRTL